MCILRKIITLFLLTIGLFSCDNSVRLSSSILGTGVSKDLATFRKENIQDIRYKLFFNIPNRKAEALKGRAEIRCKLTDTRAFLLDFKVKEEQIDSLFFNNKKVNYTFCNEHILPIENLKVGENAITIYFTCSDQSLNRRDQFLYTLLVPDRARTLFPCFDQPNLKAIYELCLEIPATWNAVANGKVLSEQTDVLSKRKTIFFQQTEPISTYLFAFSAGEFTKETFQRDKREISIFHRETDAEKIVQCTEIANEVFNALEWMENYTQIPYPFAKYDLVIIPGFQFGGMEHIGATFYTDTRMFLNKQSTLREQLIRSSLIAHETAHMWFGDYVTMEWFDDVWTKEVFANYFASLMVEPRFKTINHQLNFIVDYIPGAYGEDRTTGSNSIKQDLDNLEYAGLVYGNIIYNKSPMVMSMLSDRIGKDAFRKGIQQYLKAYAYDNATWDDLIDILDNLTLEDLKAWSHCWVNEKGRPTFEAHLEKNELIVTQSDKWHRDICWPQKLTYKIISGEKEETIIVDFKNQQKTLHIPVSLPIKDKESVIILPNIDGKGYGLFKLNENQQEGNWEAIRKYIQDKPSYEILRGSLLINLYENMYTGNLNEEKFRNNLIKYIQEEQNPLLYTLTLGYLKNCQQWFLSNSKITEKSLWQLVQTHPLVSFRLQAFRYYSSLASTPESINQLYTIWEHQLPPGNIQLSERDYMKLAYTLALHLPDKADAIISEQASRISQPDRRKEFSFISAAVSPSEIKRDSVFTILLEKENRNVEPWAADALALLNHPSRGDKAVKYIRPALEEMKEIQQTGDIFFPRSWARALLSGHTSHKAAEEVKSFFNDHPDYPLMLGNKIKQQAEHLFRSETQHTIGY